MKKYNHMFTIAFEVETTRTGYEGDEVSADELRSALLSRIRYLDQRNEWHEAIGAPEDTYEIREKGATA